MSLNSLKIATDGYLKQTTKAVLVIAVAGYLNYGSTPIPPSPNEDAYPIKVTYIKEDREDRRKIEDSEIIAIVQLCLKTTII